MKARRSLPGTLVFLGALVGSPCIAGPFSYISETETLTSVSARQFNGYERGRLPDGKFQEEAYAFGEGGEISPELFPVADPSVDSLTFAAISKTLAVPLAGQNYVTGRSPRETKLLIMVFWGRTTGSNYRNTIDGPTIDALDYWNGSLMGYDTGSASEISFHPSITGFGGGYQSTIQKLSRHDLRDDLQANRYFVILRAYDFQAAWRRGKARPLWETRFSLSERAHALDADLPLMARNASLFFGQDSHGLVRLPEVPAGRIDIGDLKVLGTTE